MILFKMMPRSIPLIIFIPVLFFSCANQEKNRANTGPEIQLDLPPKQEAPDLTILDYKNRDEGAALAPWLGNYLQNGIAGIESMTAYRGSFLFVASVHSASLPVVQRWLENYSTEKDFSRLVAQRIQKRFEFNVTGKPPDMVYGSNYEKVIKAAFYNTFWGAKRLDDFWVYAVSVKEDQGTTRNNTWYWGFILIGVTRDSLEIQINELLSRVNSSASGGNRTAIKEQNAAFDYVKGHFFEQF